MRDHVLEVRFATGDGRLVKGGGPTVKNVTGYDLPRLFVGSLGTIGVLQQATLRCRPRPAVARWFTARDAIVVTGPSARVCGTARPSAVLFEGVAADVDAQGAGSPRSTPRPRFPTARTAAASRCARRACARARTRARRARAWCAELGVGTVHVAADDASALAHARVRSPHAHGGWMFREAGGPPDDDGYGCPLPEPRRSCGGSRTHSIPQGR